MTTSVLEQQEVETKTYAQAAAQDFRAYLKTMPSLEEWKTALGVDSVEGVADFFKTVALTVPLVMLAMSQHDVPVDGLITALLLLHGMYGEDGRKAMTLLMRPASERAITEAVEEASEDDDSALTRIACQLEPLRRLAQ